MASTMEERSDSILTSLGSELLSVITPVSLCMLSVILLSSSSSAGAGAGAPPVTAATLLYSESPSDSTSQKLIGSLLDALAFVALIAIATFLLVILYYYNFTSFLKNYLRFSVFFVLTSMGGSIGASLLQKFSIPMDGITGVILLFNFGVVGVLAVFWVGIPILVRQGFMVLVAVIVAVWFGRMPEWTTWMVLGALALYDLVAVLAPRGPLRILVEMAQEREDELPALVYEARPNVNVGGNVNVNVNVNVGTVEMQRVGQRSTIDEQEGEEERSFLVSSSSQSAPNSLTPDRLIGQNENRSNQAGIGSEIGQIEHHGQTRIGSGTTQIENHRHTQIEIETTESETAPLVSRDRQTQRPVLTPSSNSSQQTETESESEIELFDSSRGIRLGLGDFVFYSVLVGRAAMYDLMTVYACYLAIISGLGCTLILLSVFRRALPALPISISLGVLFYFLTRVLMEPFVVGSATNLVMF